MISYGKQSISSEDIEAVVNVLKSDWLTQGPAVADFEKDLNDYFGSKFCNVVANGTAALHLAGLALGWGKNDVIITSPITFLASVNCIIYSGAKPDFADIDPVTFTIDLNQLEQKIKKYHKNGKEVKAVIGVDFAGHPCDWEALSYLSKKYNFQLINDNCHAMGASYNNDSQYAQKYADIVTQSFHPVKHITTGEGGSILTNDEKVYHKIRNLRTHGMSKDSNRLENNDGPWYYEMHELGYNYRITDFQSALGSSQLKKLNLFVKKRRKIAKNYDNFFSAIDYVKIPKAEKLIRHAYHLYPLRIEFDKYSIVKSEFFEKMKNLNINLQVHYIPVHLQPYYKKRYGFKKGDFPRAEKFYREEVSLPIYPELSSKDFSYVLNSIKSVLSL